MHSRGRHSLDNRNRGKDNLDRDKDSRGRGKGNLDRDKDNLDRDRDNLDRGSRDKAAAAVAAAIQMDREARDRPKTQEDRSLLTSQDKKARHHTTRSMCLNV